MNALALAEYNNNILDACPFDDLDPFDGMDIDEYLEPEEGDLISTDHERWYQDGKLVLTIDYDRDGYPVEDYREKLREYMDRSQYWPNVWIISDHGNAIIIDVWED